MGANDAYVAEHGISPPSTIPPELFPVNLKPKEPGTGGGLKFGGHGKGGRK